MIQVCDYVEAKDPESHELLQSKPKMKVTAALLS